MNKTNFDQTGGFPLETETLSKMQTAYNIFQAFGELVGTKAIIKGCKQIGTTITDGVIYWDGELIDFVGGNLQSKIIIVEEVTSVEFEDGEVNPTYYKRHATFGTGVGAVLWSEFKRAYPLSSALYLDKIDMYAGDLANIPAGWHLCNGTNGTVDLRNRFIVGYNPANTDYNAIGKTGGAEDVALNINQMPNHNHTGNTNTKSHTHSVRDAYYLEAHNNQSNLGGIENVGSNKFGSGDSDHDNRYLYYKNRQTGSHSHNHSFTTNSKGNGQAHENRPPYYTLAFIQFKGI